jgi:hypothetical protein
MKFMVTLGQVVRAVQVLHHSEVLSTCAVPVP